MIEAVADNDINEVLLEQLERRTGQRVRRIRELGMERTPDAEILAWAAEHAVVVISHDKRTMTAAANVRLAAGLTMPGLVAIRQLAPIWMVLDTLEVLLGAGKPEDLADLIMFIRG